MAPTIDQITVLGAMRALFSCAKEKHALYWQLEVLAAVLAVAASMVPVASIGAALALAAAVSKAIGKWHAIVGRRIYRSAERARRYDFEQGALGWPVPPRERADMMLTLTPTLEARAQAMHDPGYYSSNGTPGADRLLCNLAECVFYTRRLMQLMAQRRWRQVLLAFAAVIAVIVGATLIGAGSWGPVIVKMTASAVALLVTLDVLGEALTFSRGEQELGFVLDAIAAEARQATRSLDEGLRLMVEYNCLVAATPMIPDKLHEEHRDQIRRAWEPFEAALGCRS